MLLLYVSFALIFCKYKLKFMFNAEIKYSWENNIIVKKEK